MLWTDHKYAAVPLKEIRELWNTSLYYDPQEGSYENYLADAEFSSIQVSSHSHHDEGFLRGSELAKKSMDILRGFQRSAPPPAGKRKGRQPTEINETEPRKPKKKSLMRNVVNRNWRREGTSTCMRARTSKKTLLATSSAFIHAE